MFAALLSLLFAQIGAAPVVGEHFKGQCLYPDAVLERAQDTTLVTCGEVDVAPDSLTFALRGWEPSIRRQVRSPLLHPLATESATSTIGPRAVAKRSTG